MRRYPPVLAVLLGVVATSGQAAAQEIQLTGPLAGAPAVRKLRLIAKGASSSRRPSRSPSSTSTSARSWSAAGSTTTSPTGLPSACWGAFGAVHTTTGLTDRIQDVTKTRRATAPGGEQRFPQRQGLDQQLADAPEHRQGFQGAAGYDRLGRLAADHASFRSAASSPSFRRSSSTPTPTSSAGPAIVGLKERKDCEAELLRSFRPRRARQWPRPSGSASTFYMGNFISLGLEWRALPFAWNTGGFDTHGGAPDGRFPDNKLDTRTASSSSTSSSA